ncbi:hypothetical protein ACIQGZ_16965 [Streptomyces sp. NPDC092296]|uniref:hypothetical protein n=1 Tax=Streptomyces sp. NPDC092296 TaxID=3366012 RepID=UPI0038231B8F
MPDPGLAAAVAREAAWLSSCGDGLPALPTSAGGPFDVVQPYMPRTPAQRQTQLYVLRRSTVTRRFSAQRRIATHTLLLSIWWPIGATAQSGGTSLAESEQAALDAAVALVVARIEGTVTDKTHGGRFLSVAEAPDESAGVRVDMGDPAQGIQAGALTAQITYMADDKNYVA